MPIDERLAPLLVVRTAGDAIDFYVRAFGAREVVRYTNRIDAAPDASQATISHADLAIDDVLFSVTEEARAWGADAPPSLGGSPVVLQLRVDDAQAAFDRACATGAAVVFPLQDFCGEKMSRVRDPFGHLWILRQRVVDLSPEENQACRDALFAALAGAQRTDRPRAQRRRCQRSPRRASPSVRPSARTTGWPSRARSRSRAGSARRRSARSS